MLCKIFGTVPEYQWRGAHKNPEIYMFYDEYHVVFINVVDLDGLDVMRMEESDPAKKVLCTKTGGNGDRRKSRQKLRWFDGTEEKNVMQNLEN